MLYCRFINRMFRYFSLKFIWLIFISNKASVTVFNFVNIFLFKSDNAENAAKVIVGYDPGPCNITNNGIVVSLLGRDGKKKSIVCSADNKISSWQAIDG